MSLFGSSGSTAATTSTVANGIDVQTSLAGTPIQIVYGCNRVSGNLVWYGGFNAVQGSSSGGKGGTASNGQYTYYASFIMGVCQGPVSFIDRVWASKSTSETIAAAGLDFISGTIGQAPWIGLAAVSPGQILGYSGLAYVCAYNYDLGSSAELPNFNFEVAGILAGSNAPALFDANPALVFQDFLTNPYYGAGLPPACLGNFSTFQSYCQAQGLWISPVFDQSQDAASLLDTIAATTNAAFVWSGGTLNIVPYGDVALNANGSTYTPPQQPLFDLDDDDFIYAANEDPVSIERSRPADQINALSQEYLNRDNAYNPDLVQARDEASIAAWGLQCQTPASAHHFCDPVSAQISAQLQLNRQSVRNQYSFKLGWRYCMLDPMDVVSLTDPAIGLDRQWVRILSIEESEWSGSDAGVLSVKAEEYVLGTGQVAEYSFEQGGGYQPNYNTPAPSSYPPIFVEPSFQLTGGALQVWMALAGPAGSWGGADIWISQDNSNYVKVATVTESARYGYVSGGLAADQSGIDPMGSCTVDLTLSQGSLPVSPGLAASMANTSLCWTGGEFLSYATSTLVSSHAYQLGGLNRGQFGTAPAAHPAGSAFVRCDGSLAQLSVQPGLIGQTLYVKILNRNAWGGGQTTLAEAEPYTYVFQGAAYIEPLGAITGLATSYIDSIETLGWDVVQDIRQPVYEIRQGLAWGTAVPVTVTPTTSLTVTGNGTFWVAARFTTPTGYTVYGPASSVEITGNLIVRNLLDAFDEAATGWSGTCAGTGIVNGALQLAGAGNIIAATNVLALDEILSFGGLGNSGTYTVPASHAIDAGSVTSARLSISWVASAVSIYDNMLTVGNMMDVTDLLEVANGPFVSVTPQIQTAQADGIYSAWQNFAAGEYQARYFNVRLHLATSDPTINCVVTAFSFMTDVPARTDTGVNVAVPAGGLTVTYAAPFHNVPAVQVTVIGGSAGDNPVVTKTTAGFDVTVMNAGTAVARTIDWVAQGY
jgi:hypothetical protein